MTEETADELRLKLIDTQINLIQTQAVVLQYQRAEIQARLAKDATNASDAA